MRQLEPHAVFGELETASAVVKKLHPTTGQLRADRDEIVRSVDELLETHDRRHAQTDQ